MAEKTSGARSKRPSPEARTPSAGELPDEPPLSLDRIVATAVELLDAEGIDGLKMRRLADRLGAGAMSLYWHVANKEQVFDLALDSVLEYRAPPPSTQSGDWRGEVIYILEDWRAGMLRHSWSASLLSRRALGPNILIRLEALGRILSQAGVRDADLNAAIWSLWNYVMGATITRASFNRSQEDRAAAHQRLADLGERHPTIGHSRLLLDDDWDGTFRNGLDILLDGLASRR